MAAVAAVVVPVPRMVPKEEEMVGSPKVALPAVVAVAPEVEQNQGNLVHDTNNGVVEEIILMVVDMCSNYY